MVLIPPFPSSAHTIGGKARGLLLLQEAGMEVPPFVVLPAGNFEDLLQGETGAVEQRLLSYALPAEDRQELFAVLKLWGYPGQPVVVRSSIADEDGARHAFAGVMSSFLNLQEDEEVCRAIAHCAASAYAPRAVAYREQKGLTLHARPAVLIQKQVEAVASGVVFSTFPDYPQELAVHAVWGFGEGLVSGALEADEFYLLKKTGALNRQRIALKERAYYRSKNGGLKEAPVPQAVQNVPCLQEHHLQQLYQWATLLEQRLGGPQDIEFVVGEDRTWIVQSRPITQPIPEVVVYDNSNIQESYCGVTTPLTFSFAQRAYATVYTQTMEVLGLPHSVIRAQAPVVNNLLGLVKGRIYYHINNWYRGLQLLPSFRQNKSDMERMMGVEEPVDFVEDTRKTLAQKLRLLPGLSVNLLRLLWAFSRLHHTVPRFHRHFQEVYGAFYARPLQALEPPALMEQKDLLDRELLQQWTTPIINDFYVMMTNGQVVRQLQKAGIPDAEEFLSRYLAGDHQIESAQPARTLQALAEKAGADKGLVQLVEELPADLPHRVEKEYPSFYREVQAFIGLYGDRTVGELKLETNTMRQAPLIFYRYLRNYMAAGEAVRTVAPAHLHQEARAELEQKLAARSRFFRRGLYRALGKLQQSIRYREALRLERTRLFGMYRGLYTAMGERLAREGVLAASEDVFYLKENEILNLLQHPEDKTALIEERKREFDAFRKEDVPSRVVVPSPPLPMAAPDDLPADALQGTGCVGGRVTGEVIVVEGPESHLDVRGKIVCALRTDPGWVALFPTCKAVLIEKGSALSHSVILLREFGIPSIINIPQLTRRLHTGQVITIDGTAGTINIHNATDGAHSL